MESIFKLFKKPFRPLFQRLNLVLPLHSCLLSRLTPMSNVFGLDRGQPIDRYYIEAFLYEHRADIHGRVLEIQEPTYTCKFGTQVIKSDVLHITAGNPHATIVGNLETGEGIPWNTFDCIIITQTYQFIYDVKSAILNSYRALKPGGVLLATFPGISHIVRGKMMISYVDNYDICTDNWRFTDASAKRLFEDIFDKKNVIVKTYGNVLTACAFLYGLAANDLKQKELDYHDPDYQLLIAVRAIKPNSAFKYKEVL